jgi:aspartate racemase
MYLGVERRPFASLGIIAGSGPEAGVDLWTKVLKSARRKLGPEYRGDEDAPPVQIISDPCLGIAPRSFWDRRARRIALRRAIATLAPATGRFTVACNALQVEARQQAPKSARRKLVTFDQGVDWKLRELHVSEFTILGISGVASLGPSSIYAPLAARYRIRQPKDQRAVDLLIGDIKRLGADDATVIARMDEILSDHSAAPVLLACTDFPLVPVSVRPGAIVIDATEALAGYAVQLMSN